MNIHKISKYLRSSRFRHKDNLIFIDLVKIVSINLLILFKISDTMVRIINTPVQKNEQLCTKNL